MKSRTTAKPTTGNIRYGLEHRIYDTVIVSKPDYVNPCGEKIAGYENVYHIQELDIG